MKTIFDKPLFTLAVVALLLSFSACKKTDNFKAKLDSIPQISNEEAFVYLQAYGIGDTLDIVGSFDKNAVQVSIGEAENVPIAIRDSVIKVEAGNHDIKTTLDRIRVVINQNMGIGPGKKIALNIKGNLTMGHNIEIFSKYGDESFKQPLQLQTLAAMTDAGNIFLQCINGRGDLYWFDQATQSIIHKNKAGENTTIVATAQMQQIFPGFTKFVTGSVNLQGTKLWFLVQAGGYSQFAALNFGTKTINLLNNGQHANAPYEGNIAAVNLSEITGIYAGSNGNIYLRMGNDGANAVALYDEKAASIRYIFNYKQDNSPGAANPYPGTTIKTGVNEIFGFGNLRILPDENTLYLFGRKTISFLGEEIVVQEVQMLDLGTQSKLSNVTFFPIPDNNQINNTMYPGYLGPFNTFRLNVNNVMEPQQSDKLFGWMPLPGHRLQTLLYQYYWGQISPGNYGNLSQLNNLPQWSVFNFKTQRNYLYAPGRLDMKNYHLDPYFNSGDPRLTANIDELLNYDEEGHLYMTGNGRALILKTALR